ncbi:hypothetical protein EDB83DRAFT_2634624 [Lactarius deliciosus]|nr:hypothetical protein EDB83DRAFT_2634624 [Lactarius deliciosus]
MHLISGAACNPGVATPCGGGWAGCTDPLASPGVHRRGGVHKRRAGVARAEGVDALRRARLWLDAHPSSCVRGQGGAHGVGLAWPMRRGGRTVPPLAYAGGAGQASSAPKGTGVGTLSSVRRQGGAGATCHHVHPFHANGADVGKGGAGGWWAHTNVVTQTRGKGALYGAESVGYRGRRKAESEAFAMATAGANVNRRRREWGGEARQEQERYKNKSGNERCETIAMAMVSVLISDPHALSGSNGHADNGLL